MAVSLDPIGKAPFDTTYVRDSAEFLKSKKRQDPNCWRTDRGKITLQALSGSIAFRNVKLRETQ